jgi:uncharacterized protein YxjI
MPVYATCSCGKILTLGEELAGKTTRCTTCGKPVPVPGGEAAEMARPSSTEVDPVFLRKKFLLRQKHLALSEKYVVWDEGGSPILFVQRPVHFFRSLLAAFSGILAAAVVGGGFGLLASASTGVLEGVFVVAALAGAFVALVGVVVALSPKRHVFFYRDDTKRELLLQVEQDFKFALIFATYTVKDAAGRPLARLTKNYLYNMIRKRWRCTAPDGRLLSLIQEDSLIMALVRRFIVAFKTDFILRKGESEQVIGRFIRKWTLLDRYVLDLTEDTEDYLDPRIGLAIGVMLDTGERR